MAIEFLPGHFTDRDDAIAGLKARGLDCFTGDISPAELGGDAHVHPYNVEICLLSGMLEVTDCDAGRSHRLEAGCKIVVPLGTRHAEFSPAGFSAVFGVSGDLSDWYTERTPELTDRN